MASMSSPVIWRGFVAYLMASILPALTGCGPPASTAGDADAPLSMPTIVRGLGGEPETLDPVLADDNAALALLQELFEGLTTEAADGGMVPGAAESWTISPDSLRWTFVLRPDLHWSNGDPLTSTDFIAGLERARDPASRAPYAELLEPIGQMRAPDARTVVIELARPMPHLATVLALPFAGPLHSPPLPSTARSPTDPTACSRDGRVKTSNWSATPGITRPMQSASSTYVPDARRPRHRTQPVPVRGTRRHQRGAESELDWIRRTCQANCSRALLEHLRLAFNLRRVRDTDRARRSRWRSTANR